mgnify:FL=1
MTKNYKLIVHLLPVAVAALVTVGCSDATKTAKGKAAEISCHNNLRLIGLYQGMWADDNNKSPTTRVTLDNIKSQMNESGVNSSFDSQTTCPSGGSYTLTIVRELPTCSVHGTFVPKK